MKTLQEHTLNGSNYCEDFSEKRETQLSLPFTLNDCDQTYGSSGTSQPTDYPPGSSGKIELMRQRWEAGLPLFVEGDNTRALWQCETDRSELPQLDVVLAATVAIEATLEARRKSNARNA